MNRRTANSQLPRREKAATVNEGGSDGYQAAGRGTFVLVFGGVGAAVIAGEQIGNLGVAFAFGLALLAIADAIGPVSRFQINPAVTLGLLARAPHGLRGGARWVAQVLGGIVAAGVLLAIAAVRKGGYDAGTEGLGANGYGEHSPADYA